MHIYISTGDGAGHPGRHLRVPPRPLAPSHAHTRVQVRLQRDDHVREYLQPYLHVSTQIYNYLLRYKNPCYLYRDVIFCSTSAAVGLIVRASYWLLGWRIHQTAEVTVTDAWRHQVFIVNPLTRVGCTAPWTRTRSTPRRRCGAWRSGETLSNTSLSNANTQEKHRGLWNRGRLCQSLCK